MESNQSKLYPHNVDLMSLQLSTKYLIMLLSLVDNLVLDVFLVS